MKTMTRVVLPLLVALLVAACASGGGGADGTPRDDTQVSGAELAQYMNLRIALQELRPSWLRRAREVFVDMRYAGSVGILQRSFNERIQYVELVPSRDVIRRFGPCQAPGGTGTIDTPRDPQCGTRPVIHIVLFSRD